MKEKILWGIAIIGLVFGTWAVVSIPRTAKLPNGQYGASGNLLAEQYIPYVLYNQGYNSAKGMTISGETTLSGTNVFSGSNTMSGTSNFTALVTLNAGQLRSNPLSTSTPASMTLKLSDIQGYDTILVAATEAAAAKAFTFFSSSTAGTTWLPTAGDMQETCFVNSTTTSGVNLTFTAGPGIILQTATSTAGGIGAPTIAPNNIGCFKFVRHTNTDITAAFTTYKDAD